MKITSFYTCCFYKDDTHSHKTHFIMNTSMRLMCGYKILVFFLISRLKITWNCIFREELYLNQSSFRRLAISSKPNTDRYSAILTICKNWIDSILHMIDSSMGLTTNNGIFDNNENKRSFVLCLCSLYIIVLSG